ncbi:MAG: zinc finger protein [Pseudonocardiaceae bacterium]
MPTSYFNPRTFGWFPLAGQRHAIELEDRRVLRGKPMRCLCGVAYPRGASGDEEWLWPTCQQCWDKTCEIEDLHPSR